MAFSGRARRPGAFSGGGAAAAAPPQDVFDGEWLDDDGIVILIKDCKVHVPESGVFAFQVKSTTTCSFAMEGETYTGTLGADGKLSWNDGCIWAKKSDEAAQKKAEEDRMRAEAEAQRQEEEQRRAEEKKRAEEEARQREEENKRKAQEDERKKKEQQDKEERERQIEAAKKKAAEERAKAVAEAARKAADEKTEVDPTIAAAKAKSAAGVDKAKAAYEAEKARKAAALERARAAKAAEAEAKAAAKAGAAPAAATPEVAEAKAQSAAGIDKAKQAYEAEKARKAAAMERAKAAKAAAEAQAAEKAPPAAPAPSGSEFAEAKAKSSAGLDKARQAYEAEKARKAAALERARAAKAAEAAAAAEGKTAESDAPPAPVPHNDPIARGPPQPPPEKAAQPTKRVSAFEAAQAKTKSEPAKRPSAFEAAQAKATSEPAKRPSAFEAAQAKTKSEPTKKPSAFEAAQAKAQAAQPKKAPAQAAPAMDRYDGLDGIAFEAGSVVRLNGLKSRPELNGLIGVLVVFDDDKGRWQLRVEGMGDTLLNLKEDNLVAVSQEEFDEWQEEQAQQEAAVAQEEQVDFAKLVNSKISGESMRWTDTVEGKIRKQPGPNGNIFDIEMSEEPDGFEAAEKICTVLKKQGVCVCEANAPYEMLVAAYDEATNLYNNRSFTPCMDGMGASELEIELWQRTLYQDESQSCWVSEASEHVGQMKNLRALAQNLQTFATSLGEPLGRLAGVHSNSMWDAMLACYTGDRTYAFHLDNPANNDDHSLPDNGLRLTLCYYINPQWDPRSMYNGGGMDVFLTNPSTPPASSAAARRADRLRIAPHADTLAVFLSQRMAHQMIQTKGTDKWFCLWLWCMDEAAMGEFPQKVVDKFNAGLLGEGGAGGDDEDDDGPHKPPDSDSEECLE